MFEACKQLVEGNATAFSECAIAQGFVGGLSGVLVGFGILAILGIILAVYIYHSFAWMIIGRKLKYKHPWFAWIPFLGTAMRLQMGGFHWAWTFLYLIPVLGWIVIFVLLIISYWKVFEKRNYPGWFSLSIILPKIGGLLYLIAIGFVAWKDRKTKLFS